MNIERLAAGDDMPRFSQHFWGRDDAGYSALTMRMRHAKLTCQEILSMFQARAALEEEYGKKLLKLSKSPLGKDEVGSLRDSLDVVRFEIEATGKSHIELSGKMRDQLESALAEFNNTQKEKRKQQQAAIERTFRSKQLCLQHILKAKEKYDAECSRTKGLSAAKMNLQGKELDKVSMKMEKTELATRVADVDYQASIRQLTEVNDKWIVEWRTACDKFQLLEEQRIDYVRTTLWNYANIISSTCVADDESCERIRSSLEQCDVGQNLQSFIEASATGDETLDIPTFLSSHMKNSDGLDFTGESPAIARLQGQDIKVRTVSGPHQPLPGTDTSNSSSRRQSYVDGRADGPNYSLQNEAVVMAPVEMALAIGNNVFKLDPETAGVPNQAEDNKANLPGNFPQSTGNKSPGPAPRAEVRTPVMVNSLGISLDVSGSVKENRFPHWQLQAQHQQQHGQQQQQTHSGFVGGSGYQQQRAAGIDPSHPPPNSRMLAQGPLTHSRSQTMPHQNEPGRGGHTEHEAGTHRRSLSGAPAGADQQGHANQFHPQIQQQHHQQQQHQPAAGSANSGQQTTPDGKIILFYARAMYDYDATIPEELSLKGGDVLAVLHTRDDGWWEGDLLDAYSGPRRGLFPSNFTEPIA